MTTPTQAQIEAHEKSNPFELTYEQRHVFGEYITRQRDKGRTELGWEELGWVIEAIRIAMPTMNMEDCDGDFAEIEQIAESRANIAAAADVGSSPYAPEAKVAWQRAAERDNATIMTKPNPTQIMLDALKLIISDGGVKHDNDGLSRDDMIKVARKALAAIRALKDKP